MTASIIESMDENKTLSQDDFQFLDILEQGIKRLDNETLEIPLPFKTRPVMPDNYWCVKKRFTGLKKKLDKDIALKNEYETFMEGLFTKGHAELVPVNSHANEGEVWYIPHFAVTHPKKKEEKG